VFGLYIAWGEVSYVYSVPNMSKVIILQTETCIVTLFSCGYGGGDGHHYESLTHRKKTAEALGSFP
jgi:hypothetical protein